MARKKLNLHLCYTLSYNRGRVHAPPPTPRRLGLGLVVLQLYYQLKPMRSANTGAYKAIEGGFVTQVEQLEMPRMIREAKADAKMCDIACQIDAKYLSFHIFVVQFGT